MEQNRNGGNDTAWWLIPAASISVSRTPTSYWDTASGSAAFGPTPLTRGSRRMTGVRGEVGQAAFGELAQQRHRHRVRVHVEHRVRTVMAAPP